jgi:hypothetical protein
MDGRPIELTGKINMIANNGLIHEEMLETLATVGAKEYGL